MKEMGYDENTVMKKVVSLLETREQKNDRNFGHIYTGMFILVFGWLLWHFVKFAHKLVGSSGVSPGVGGGDYFWVYLISTGVLLLILTLPAWNLLDWLLGFIGIRINKDYADAAANNAHVRRSITERIVQLAQH